MDAYPNKSTGKYFIMVGEAGSGRKLLVTPVGVVKALEEQISLVKR